MSPILGIFASSKAAAAGDFESIATVTVGSGGAANVEFTSIAADWTHLQIRSIARCTTNDGTYMQLQFNSDTGSNYALHNLFGNGSNAQAEGYANFSFGYAGYISQNNQTASSFGVAVLDILDYKNTNKFKTTRSLNGSDVNGSGNVILSSSLWRSTNAITSIKLTPNSGNFAQYSHFALYGIKGA